MMGTGTHLFDSAGAMGHYSNLDCDVQAGYARRLQRVEIGCGWLAQRFQLGHRERGWEVCERGWPSDTRIVDARMSPNQMGIVLTLESDSFEPIREGQIAPLVAGPTLRDISKPAADTKGE